MIVTDYADLKVLMNGQEIEQVVGSRPPTIGATVTVQPAVGERSVCRAQVVDVWDHRDGGYVVMLGGNVVVLRKLGRKREIRRVVIREEPVRLMKRGGGDTSAPEGGMRDSSHGHIDPLYGVEIEPEMVPKNWKDPGVPLRAEQQATLHRATRERLSLGAQLDSLLAEARDRGVEAHDHVRDRTRRIQRELQLLARDLGAAA